MTMRTAPSTWDALPEARSPDTHDAGAINPEYQYTVHVHRPIPRPICIVSDTMKFETPFLRQELCTAPHHWGVSPIAGRRDMDHELKTRDSDPKCEISSLNGEFQIVMKVLKQMSRVLLVYGNRKI